MSTFSRIARVAAVCTALFAAVAPALLCARVAHAQEYNEKTPHYADAVSAFKAASIIVLGRDLSMKDAQVYSGSGTFGYSGITAAGFTTFFTTNEMVQMFAEYDKQAASGDKIADGINFTDAVKFLKTKLTKQNPDSNKMLLILLDQAFATTYGRPSTPTEQALWMAKIRANGLWYAPVKLDMAQQLNNDKAEKTATIHRVYAYTLGRDASPDETGYWLAPSTDFEHMVLANRVWLFSAKGADELPQVVTRALQAGATSTGNGRPKPLISDAKVKEMMNTFSDGKGLVYAEMVQYLAKNKS